MGGGGDPFPPPRNARRRAKWIGGGALRGWGGAQNLIGRKRRRASLARDNGRESRKPDRARCGRSRTLRPRAIWSARGPRRRGLPRRN